MKKITTFLITILISTLGFGQIPLDSLVAHYPFNANANDSSGNGNHGTVIGATLTTDRCGNDSSAYQFNGIDQYINLFHQNFNDFSVSVWFNSDTSYMKKGGIIGKITGAGIYDWRIVQEDGIGETWLNGPGIEYGMFFNNSKYGIGYDTDTTSKWYHVVSTFDQSANIFKMYVDGNLQTTGNSTGARDYNTVTIKVGCKDPIANVGNPFAWFKGKIDDIRIYEGILTPAEVLALYNEDCTTCQLPVAGFTADTSNSLSVQFTDTSNSATTWSWDFGDLNQSSQQNPVHLYASTGWYYVCLIITDSCGSDTLCDSIYVSESVGIGQLANGYNQFTIYPNPTEGKFEVRSLEFGVEKVEVYDLFGRLVLSSTTPQIDMRGFAKGVYVVKAGQAVRKLVIE